MSTDIPQLLRENFVHIDEKMSSEVEENFMIEKRIGTGGTGIVFKAKVVNNVPELNLYSGMNIALKICKPFMGIEACELFKTEVDATSKFLKLNYDKLCYNYQAVYGYFYKCLFFSNKDVNIILDYIKKNNVNTGVDAFILYCSIPDHINMTDIDSTIVSYVLKTFDPEFLVESRKKLPKTNNIKGLYELSRLDNKELKENDWDDINEIYDHLDMRKDMTCDMFIIYQYLEGKTLRVLKYEEDTNYRFTDSIFFEFLYSTAISICKVKKQQIDIQPTNQMIVKTKIPRIYKYNNLYYLITGDMFFWIDIQDLNDINFSEMTKSSFKLGNFYTEEQKKVIDNIFEERHTTLEKFFNVLFDWIRVKKNIVMMNRDMFLDYIIVNYNYRLVDLDVLSG